MSQSPPPVVHVPEERAEIEAMSRALTDEIAELTRVLHLKLEIQKRLRVLLDLKDPSQVHRTYRLTPRQRRRSGVSKAALAFLKDHPGRRFTSREVALALAAASGEFLGTPEGLDELRTAVTMALSRHAARGAIDMVEVLHEHGEHVWSSLT